MQKLIGLQATQLSLMPNKRMIAQALKDDTVLNTTFIGQERAREALSFGLGVKAKGYNLYVMGEQATGRYTLVHEYINKTVESTEAPDEWCYINNFDDERTPFALRLKPTESKSLVKDMDTLLDEIMDTFPAAYDNPGYQRKKAAIGREFDQRYDNAIDEVERLAQSKSVALHEENGTISFAPIVNGKPITDTEFAQLDDQQRQSYYELIDGLEDRLSETLIELPQWKRKSSEQLRQLKRDTAEQGIKPLLKALEHKYGQDIAVLKYLRQLKNHMIDTVVEVLASDSKDDKQDEYDRREILEEQYLPNVLVSHQLDDGAPVVYESNPTYQNLFGKIEYSNLQGSTYTSYRMIQAGALHRANGGFLLLDADKMVEQPYVWESLKRALKFGELRLDFPQADVGMVNSMTLNPQQIPLDVKVVLLGSRDLYYLLQDHDEEFDEHFRVLVDFDHEIPANKKNVYDFVGRVRHHVSEIGLDGVSNKAMNRLIEYSLRLAEHQEYLSARFSDIIELINESHYFVLQSNMTVLDVDSIELALSAKTRRSGRVSEALLNDIKEGQILIDTMGKTTGQVNGLTVLEIGDSVFGTPARITSTVYAGSNGVVDIEREVELGQPIHSKGVMLLTGYLGHKYAQYFPLTLSANIAIEQSYGHIDGDSASLGELVALISALTNVPVRQDLAITGSINQYGEVQAVGGVNEKIEGFFKLCQQRGLTGSQGVIIPHSNRANLMLNSEVVSAVEDNLFHIFTAQTVDQAVTLLMESEAGELNSKGRYPKGSINYLAVNRLYGIASIVNGSEPE